MGVRIPPFAPASSILRWRSLLRSFACAQDFACGLPLWLAALPPLTPAMRLNLGSGGETRGGSNPPFRTTTSRLPAFCLKLPGRSWKLTAVHLHDAFILFAAALLAGVANSISGGGSFISFPALLLTGVPPIQANTTNTAAIWPGVIASTVAYRREVSAHRRLDPAADHRGHCRRPDRRQDPSAHSAIHLHAPDSLAAADRDTAVYLRRPPRPLGPRARAEQHPRVSAVTRSVTVILLFLICHLHRIFRRWGRHSGRRGLCPDGSGEHARHQRAAHLPGQRLQPGGRSSPSSSPAPSSGRRPW